MAQDKVDDGDDVGQALARAGAGGEYVAIARRGGFHRLRLMLVEMQGLVWLANFLDAKDGAAFRMELAAGDEVVDPWAGLKAGVQLQERIGPEQAVAQLLIDQSRNTVIADGDEAFDVGTVVVDKLVAESKCIHPVLLRGCGA